MITHLPDQRSTVEHYSGELHEAPELLFGRAGELSPKSWRLTVTKVQLPTSSTVAVQYDLTLEAELPKSNFSRVLGRFGYPAAGVMDDYSYGFGVAGLISEVPEAILSEARKVSGIENFSPVEEISYEYSYVLMSGSSTPERWFTSPEEAKDALEANGDSQADHYFLRRESPSVEVFHP